MFLFAFISFLAHPVLYIRDWRFARKNFGAGSRFNGGDELFGPGGYPDDSLYRSPNSK